MTSYVCLPRSSKPPWSTKLLGNLKKGQWLLILVVLDLPKSNLKKVYVCTLRKKYTCRVFRTKSQKSRNKYHMGTSNNRRFVITAVD